MENLETCPECGANWHDGQTCQDYFHQMLYWEAEFPEYGIVHHYMVLCYHMQHPSLYSPAMLEKSKQILADFLAGTTPQEMRNLLKKPVDSGNRQWKIKGTPDSHGRYKHPVRWTMTCQDVVMAGVDQYVESVKAWAQSIHDALHASGN